MMPAAACAQAASEPPLPPVETVLARLLEQAQKEDEQERAFKEHYAYERTKITEFRNAKGVVKKREEDKSVKNPLIVKVGRASRVEKLRTDAEEDATANAEVTDSHSNVRGKAFEKSDFPLNGELLKRFEFKLTGRELLKGRPALILDFKPVAGKLPERNLKERFINKAAGRVWVDEADYNLPKARLFLTERVNVVGGLVGAVWKFTYDFDRERTPEGLWYTRTVDWHLEGREVFVRRTVEYHEERTNVTKVK
jgi:hypothetical protein